MLYGMPRYALHVSQDHVAVREAACGSPLPAGFPFPGMLRLYSLDSRSSIRSGGPPMNRSKGRVRRLVLQTLHTSAHALGGVNGAWWG